jgi:hypothetical protein
MTGALRLPARRPATRPWQTTLTHGADDVGGQYTLADHAARTRTGSMSCPSGWPTWRCATSRVRSRPVGRPAARLVVYTHGRAGRSLSDGMRSA